MNQIDHTKCYQTLDGQPVRILCVDAPGDYPVIGYIDDGVSDPEAWTASGKYFSDSNSPSPEDLVEVREKRRLNGWINVFSDGVGEIAWQSKEQADSNASRINSKRRVACVDLSKFEYEVGDGL